MSVEPTDNSFVFVVRTDRYTGNFEREMTAYITGQVGECEVGEEIAARESDDIKHLEWFEDHVKQVPDDHGCARPCYIWQVPEDAENVKEHANGYSAVGIFFEERPPAEVIAEMKERASEWASEFIPFGNREEVNILGFQMVEYRVTVDKIREEL